VVKLFQKLEDAFVVGANGRKNGVYIRMDILYAGKFIFFAKKIK
jgi:hypothetical protein